MPHPKGQGKKATARNVPHTLMLMFIDIHLLATAVDEELDSGSLQNSTRHHDTKTILARGRTQERVTTK